MGRHTATWPRHPSPGRAVEAPWPPERTAVPSSVPSVAHRLKRDHCATPRRPGPRQGGAFDIEIALDGEALSTSEPGLHPWFSPHLLAGGGDRSCVAIPPTGLGGG